jgi:predicted nucleic acid-binding protein
VDETATFASEFAVDMQDPLPIGAALAGGAMKSMKVENRDKEINVANSLRIIQPF